MGLFVTLMHLIADYQRPKPTLLFYFYHFFLMPYIYRCVYEGIIIITGREVGDVIQK